MPTLRIDVETVEALAAKIKSERNGTVNELIARLHAINNQLDAAWDGPALTQFQGTYGNWVEQLEHYSDTLNSIYQYLVSVAQNFRELDEAARSAAANAASRADKK
jgi:WXG100 family type VII secretion target